MAAGGSRPAGHAQAGRLDDRRRKRSRQQAAHRRVPGGAAGSWLARRPEHPYRIPLGRRPGRARSPVRAGTGRARARRDPRQRHGGRCGTEGADPLHPDRLCLGHRSGWFRVRRQPVAPGRQHHRFQLHQPGTDRKMDGADQGRGAGRQSSGALIQSQDHAVLPQFTAGTCSHAPIGCAGNRADDRRNGRRSAKGDRGAGPHPRAPA